MKVPAKAMTSEEIESVVAGIIHRHMPAGMSYKVFLFGSRATGRGTERSDHDIGIEADGHVPFGVLADIRLEVEELPTLHKVDVVDFGRVSMGFKSVATEGAKELYAR